MDNLESLTNSSDKNVEFLILANLSPDYCLRVTFRAHGDGGISLLILR